MGRAKRLTAISTIVCFIISGLLSGCARPLYKASYFEYDDEWIRMVSDYRKQSKESPDNPELKLSLKNAEFDAAEHFYRAALDRKTEGRLDEAIATLQKGLAVMPGNEKLAVVLTENIAIRESENSFKEASILKEAGKYDEAKKLFEKTLLLDPSNISAAREIESIDKEQTGQSTGLPVSDKKITLKFNNTDLKTVLDFIASAYGFNVIYDEGIKSVQVNAAGQDLSLEDAVDMVMSTGGVFYKKVGPTTILVAQDTKAKHDQYEDLIIRTFQLNTLKASDMSTILKNTLNLKRVTVNETLNMITIRDTEDMLKLADKLIQVNDLKPAEVIFDVEIIEVNRTKAEQLGLDYGGQIKLALPSNQTAGTVMNTTFKDILKQGTITLPAFTLNFFKQDVNAKMLANPRVRVIEGKKAKIHIGDRVPLRSSIVQDASGQVRYSYDYKDIGVMLEVTPDINLDNSVNVLLHLEVSSLGSNIGTQTDPAYSIGTRDADTTMLLRDGETAILGGLIRDEERHNVLKVPLLGDIPVIGGLFATSSDDSGARTDVLLTITPRVVRGWDKLGKDLREIYSGTENNTSSKRKFYAKVEDVKGVKKEKAQEKTAEQPSNNAPLAAATQGTTIQQPVTLTAAAQQPVTQPEAAQAVAAQTAAVQQAVTQTAATQQQASGDAMLSFSEDQYILQNGQDGAIMIMCENLKNVPEMSLKVAFNAAYVKFQQAENPAPGVVTALKTDDSKSSAGTIGLALTFDTDKDTLAKTGVVTLKFTALKKGVSYLIFLESKMKDKDGNIVNAQRKASRLVIK